MQVIQSHAYLIWLNSEEEISSINLTKIDVAMDCFGSFIPGSSNHTYSMKKKLLNDLVGRVFCGDDTNFLSLTKVEDLRVHSGENNLDSCKQFQIKDGEHCKIMIVKFYDKLLDLVAREGTHQVGSRMATVLGSSHKLSVFNKRLSSSQYTGLSRLEVSICEEALMKYKIW